MWLLIDVQNSCHRLFHALPPMTGPMGRSEVLFGFLRDIRNLQAEFDTKDIAFFFDYDKPIRCDILPEYKANRAESKLKRADTGKDDAFLQYQINLLRDLVLPRLGFNNVFFESGYEADDLIVSFHLYVVQGHGRSLIVSSDKDFWQSLQEDLRQYDPRTTKTHGSNTTMDELKLTRSQYVKMKAIAGCSSDNIPGIEGVGDKTAIKYLLGELPKDSTKYKLITKSTALIDRNIKLVQLPYPGTPIPQVEKDTVTDTKWKTVLKQLGISKIRI